MSTFPPEFRQSALIGQSLSQICFNGNQIVFHFALNHYIVAEVEFRYTRAGSRDDFTVISVPSLQSDLMHLIEHEVKKTDIADGCILTLHFEDGAALQFFDFWEGGPYESYIVVIEGVEFRI